MQVKDIMEITGGKLLCGKEDVDCNSFCKDTRLLKENDVYVGIKGDNFDGNVFFQEAFEKGARVCLLQGDIVSKEEIEKYEKENKVIIQVEDTILAIGKIAAKKRSMYNIPVVAVTGSVGKTSTKDIIASVVQRKYKVLKTQGNNNNHIGLPFTILSMKDEEALVIEMGMNHSGEISYLTHIAKPTIAVITNVGTSHIGNLGSRENILKAKLEILEGLAKEGAIIINNDNDLLHKWNLEDKEQRKITYGITEKSDFVPYDIIKEETKSTYHIKVEDEEYTVEVPVSGNHFVYNSLSAIAVGKELKIPMQEIVEGIKQFELTKNRMDVEKIELKENGKITLIKDYYNASYDSMKAALEYLKQVKGKRKIAVLGDMLELGKYAQELHEAVGEEVVKQNVDILITGGKLARNIAKEAERMGMNPQNIFSFETNKEIIEKLEEIEQTGDVILLKASNAMKFSQIAQEIKKKSRIKVAVILGGMSTEHEVSIVSGVSIIKKMDQKQYEIFPVYMDKQGKWFRYNKKIEEIPEVKVGEELYDLEEITSIEEFLEKMDCVFPVLHGLYGEDGTIQGLLEMFKVPYVGCKVLSSAVCMDKTYTKIILEKAGLKQAKYVYIKSNKEGYEYIRNLIPIKMKIAEILDNIEKELSYPMFVKPSNSGSSVGISKVKNRKQLEEAITFATKFDTKILIEQGIIGREIECAVLGSEEIITSSVGEILSAEEFYSFDSKYNNTQSRTVIPADMEKDIIEEIRKQAKIAFQAVDGSGLARVDFFVEKDTNQVYINEINTMPGFTQISMYPKLIENIGISYTDLLSKLISIALND